MQSLKNNSSFFILLVIFIFIGGCKKMQTFSDTTSTKIPVDTTINIIANTNLQHISVTTQHNDNGRTGHNSNETVLNTTTVNATQFRKLFSLLVDDEVYAQPLVMGNFEISGAKHNVVFIATVNNTLYAFDGDNGKLYWTKNYTVNGMRTPTANDVKSAWCTPYLNITANIGIIGSPVIDSLTKTIYFVARSTDGVIFKQHLHAVDLTTGNEKLNSPIEITAQTAGKGDASINDKVSFDPFRNNQRQGLALVKGVVYISYASHCDLNPFHGWVLGYDAKNLQQQYVYNTTPDGEEGGIWQSGMGIAADEDGNLYIVTGNGTVGTPSPYSIIPGNGTAENIASIFPENLSGRSESAIKLTPSSNSSLKITSYFTPTNYVKMNITDADYGVLGSMLVPNSNIYFTGAKDGNLYILDKDNMGGYSANFNNVKQTIKVIGNLHAQPAYFKGANKEYAYVWSENDRLRAIEFDRATNSFNTNQTFSNAPGPSGQTGAMISVSSDNGKAGTGIVWAFYASSGDAENGTQKGMLRAFDANDISKELWNSGNNPGDYVPSFAKFCSPTIANGRVYLATFSGQVLVYGLIK
jgi:hypothetical protein